MRTFKRKQWQPLVGLVVLWGTFSCGDDEVVPDEGSFNVLASSGTITSLDGFWASGCVTDRGVNLSETMEISEGTILLDILIFEDGQCGNQVGQEDAVIEFNVGATIEADLDGELVQANRITGIFTQDGDTESFKQTLYLDDSGSSLELYHARFGDDGGTLSSDGFPIDLIPISIVRQ